MGTTILTFTLWPLNKEWWWQHSQFLRCFYFLSKPSGTRVSPVQRLIRLNFSNVASYFHFLSLVKKGSLWLDNEIVPTIVLSKNANGNVTIIEAWNWLWLIMNEPLPSCLGTSATHLRIPTSKYRFPSIDHIIPNL